MWLLWALLSALFASVRRTNEKRLTHRLNHFTISFMVQLLSLPIISAALLVTHSWINPMLLPLRFWIPFIIVCIGFYPLNAFLYLQAIKESDISKVLPLQSLSPVLALLPAWMALGEVPSAPAAAGMTATVIGVYILGMKRSALHHPWQPFREEKGTRYMLYTVLLVNAASILDKLAVGASNPIFYSFTTTIGAVIVLYATVAVFGIREMRKLSAFRKDLLAIGSLQGSSYTTFLLALSAGPVAYVTAVRSVNILIGALLGIFILKEELTPYKAISFAFILSGGILLALGS